MSDRVPPQNVEAELAVLGSLLVDAQGAMPVLAPVLAQRDFYRGVHREIYGAALALYERREPTDSLLLADELIKRGTLEDVGGAPFLAGLVNSTPSAVHALHYAGIVREAAVRRRLISAGGTIAGFAYDAKTAAEAVSQAQETVLSLSAGQARETLPIERLASDFLDYVAGVVNAPGRATGLPTGFHRLDQLTSGFRPGQLVILAARPGVGKTSLALHFALLAAEQSVPVTVFTLEMAPDELFSRLACSHAGVDSRRVRGGWMTDDELHAVTEAAGYLAQQPLRVIDAAGMSITDLAARARQEQAQYGAGFVIVDYLGLLRGPKAERGENRTQEVAAISRELTVLARELRVPVLALSQLNRAVEQGGNKKPQLSNLRDSGALEQDAHMVMLLHQDEALGVPLDYLNIILAKNRSGPTGEVTVAFDQQYTRFRDLETNR